MVRPLAAALSVRVIPPRYSGLLCLSKLRRKQNQRSSASHVTPCRLLLKLASTRFEFLDPTSLNFALMSGFAVSRYAVDTFSSAAGKPGSSGFAGTQLPRRAPA